MFMYVASCCREESGIRGRWRGRGQGGGEGKVGISYPTNRAMGQNSLSLRYKLTFKQLGRMHSTHTSMKTHTPRHVHKGKHTDTHTHTHTAVTLQHAFPPKEFPRPCHAPSPCDFLVNCIDGKKCVRVEVGNGIVYLAL